MISLKKAQISNATIWIILTLLLMFITFFIFSDKIDLFQNLIGLKE